jgi:hypothetical protein
MPDRWHKVAPVESWLWQVPSLKSKVQSLSTLRSTATEDGKLKPGGKRLKPEVGTGTVRVVGNSLLATKRVAWTTSFSWSRAEPQSGNAGTLKAEMLKWA